LSRLDDAYAERGIGSWLDLDGWTLAATCDDAYEGDWKLFMEVYGDCYHVPPYHPGLASFVDCGTVEWELGADHHVQFLARSALRGRRSKRYARWSDGIDAYHLARGERPPTMGVAWMALYPNLMFEAYAGLRVLSVIVPVSADRYVNRVHYFVPSDADAVVPGLVDDMRAAYDETVDEDRALVESRRAGLRTAASLGLAIDRYRAVMVGAAPEAGVAHFHDWYRARMGR
jgi:choline monooxygenase